MDQKSQHEIDAEGLAQEHQQLVQQAQTAYPQLADQLREIRELSTKLEKLGRHEPEFVVVSTTGNDC